MILAIPAGGSNSTSNAPSSQDTGGISSLTGTSTTNVSAPPEGIDEVRVNLDQQSLVSNGDSVAAGKGVKKRRRSSMAVQVADAEKCKRKKIESRGMKLATRRIFENDKLSPSNPKRKTHKAIVDEVNQTFGSNVNRKTAGRMVSRGLIGVSPLKSGPVGNFPKNVWNAMKTAFVTYIKLELSLSAKQSTLGDHAKRVNALVNAGGFNKKGYEVAQKLRKETADEIEVGRKNVQEQRRVLWTTYSNIKLWYDTWEDTLIELGFARKKEDADDVEAIEGSLFFYKGQRRRIINLDETDGSMDNTNGKRGGRPPIVFYSGDIRGGATQASKSSYSPTIICGSNAKGEALPPHFQLKTTAQSAEGQRINLDFVANCKSITGKFGFEEMRTFDCTFGMNEKAGMNSEELQKYFMKCIVPLYPDLEDRPLKRVLVKVDSGPGRTNLEMLAQLRLRGLYLMPGVPNTTSVTQETDQNYGPFKTVYRQNLQTLSQERFEVGKCLTINDLPLLVFGQEGSSLRDAFAESFSNDVCLSAWRQCGSVPLTRNALQSNKVRHQITLNPDGTVDEEGDPESKKLLEIESANHFACDYLSGLGFDGSQLRLNAPRIKKRQQLTVPFSKERLAAIQEAKSAGQLFYAMGGTMLNSSDTFRARALDARKKEMAKFLEAKMKAEKRLDSIRTKAFDLIARKGDLTPLNHHTFTAVEIKTLLQFKLGKTTGKKSELIDRYINTPMPPKMDRFTAEDGERLAHLKNEEVSLKETALGDAAKQNVNAVINNLDQLDDSEREKLLQALTKDKPQGLPKDDNNYL